MSTHNIGFYGDLTKIIFELSSNTHLISSAAQFSTFTTTFQRFLTDRFRQTVQTQTRL